MSVLIKYQGVANETLTCLLTGPDSYIDQDIALTLLQNVATHVAHENCDTRLPSNLRRDHLRMHVFSYLCSLPVM